MKRHARPTLATAATGRFPRPRKCRPPLRKFIQSTVEYPLASMNRISSDIWSFIATNRWGRELTLARQIKPHSANVYFCKGAFNLGEALWWQGIPRTSRDVTMYDASLLADRGSFTKQNSPRVLFNQAKICVIKFHKSPKASSKTNGISIFQYSQFISSKI